MKIMYYLNPLLLSFLLCGMWGIPGQADDFLILKEKLIANYVERTSFPITELLTRPASGVPTNINVVCLAQQQKCNNSLQALRKFVKAPWLSPIDATNSYEDINSFLISLVLFSDAKEAAKKLNHEVELTFREGQKAFGEGEEVCKVNGIIGGLEVSRIVITANMKLGEKRLVSCVLSSLARSSGLAFFPSYADQWRIGGELEGASEEDYIKTMRGSARLLAIHLSSFTRPGMSAEEFAAVTRRISLWDLIGEQ